MARKHDYYMLVLKLILWDMALYHILLGLLGLMYENHLAFITGNIFNLSISITTETLSLIRPLAVYVIAFGIMMAIAAYDPTRYRPIVYAGLILLVFRLVQYVAIIAGGFAGSADRPTQTYGLMSVVIFTGLAFAFLLWKTRVRQRA